MTDESIAEFYGVIPQYWTAANASMGIVDFSTVSEFELSSALIRQLAEREPCMPDATNRPRVIGGAERRRHIQLQPFDVGRSLIMH